MERETLAGKDPCELARKWGVDLGTMSRLVLSAEDFQRETLGEASIISGWRTKREQETLGRSGRPAAPDNLSTHRSCPATGADIGFSRFLVTTEKHIWGRIVFMNGLRWGGGSELDDELIPLDWHHIDRGPRT